MQLQPIVIRNKKEADLVLETMEGCIRQYGEVTISDLKNMIGMSPIYEDTKWGWTNMNGEKITEVDEGYLLDFSQPISLRDPS